MSEGGAPRAGRATAYFCVPMFLAAGESDEVIAVAARELQVSEQQISALELEPTDERKFDTTRSNSLALVVDNDPITFQALRETANNFTFLKHTVDETLAALRGAQRTHDQIYAQKTVLAQAADAARLEVEQLRAALSRLEAAADDIGRDLSAEKELRARATAGVARAREQAHLLASSAVTDNPHALGAHLAARLGRR